MRSRIGSMSVGVRRRLVDERICMHYNSRLPEHVRRYRNGDDADVETHECACNVRVRQLNWMSTNYVIGAQSEYA